MPATPSPLLTVPPVIRTAHLDLVESDPAFAPAFAEAMAASHDAIEFAASWRAASDVDKAARSMVVSRERAEHELVRHAFVRETGRWVSRVDLHSWDWSVPRCEVGYLSDARQAGRGHTREAVLAMVEVAWSLGAVRVQALTDTRNHRAVKFALDLGFTREGTLRRYERDDNGALCDLTVFSLLR